MSCAVMPNRHLPQIAICKSPYQKRMNRIKTIACIGLLALAQLGGAKAQTLRTERDSASYAIGMDVAKSLLNTGFEIDPGVFLKGLEAVYQGGGALFGEEEKMRVIQTAFGKATARRKARLQAAETAFFDSIRIVPNVRHLQDGLYYEVIREGNGDRPTADDGVTVHYKGTLANGKPFDSSYDRGQPAQLELKNVIKGWQMGIPLMAVGSKYRLYIPSALGYGERGAGANIPPHSPLVFEIELFGIKAKESEDTVQPQ